MVDYRVEPSEEITADLQGPTVQLKPGTRLQQGRYIIDDVIGKGGMGHVYKIRDTHFRGPMAVRAVKEMIPRFSDLQANIINFEREADILASLRHSGIPRVYDSFAESRRAYLVLEYIAGMDLERVLQQSDSLLSETQICNWMCQLCSIVEYLHSRDIIFRDLKPSNVILTPEQEIILIDFGIAKVFQDDEQQTNVGTNGYAPPEQYERRAEKRSDIYSLGAMMHHLLTKTDPRFQAPFSFHERPVRALNPGVSQAMVDVVERCLNRDLAQRYQTIGELRRALEDVLGVSTSSRSYGTTAKGLRAGTAPFGAGRTMGGNGPRVAWHFQTEEEIRATPSTDGSQVFIGSYDNNLYSLSLSSGKYRWQVPTEGGICGAAAVWKDYVIFGSEDFNVYAVERTTGKEVWRYRTWNHVRTSPRIYEDRLYVGSDDGHMHAIDPQTGRLIWRHKTYREVQSSAAYANGTLFFGSNDECLYAVDAVSGEKKWSYATKGEVICTPAVADQNVYVGSFDFGIYSLEVKSGWLAWCERTELCVISSPCISGDRIYVGSTDQYLYCLNKRTGSAHWKFHAGGQLIGSPVLLGGAVIFGCRDGNLYCLDAATGKSLWCHSIGEKLIGSPMVHDGMIYVGSTDGALYALAVDH